MSQRFGDMCSDPPCPGLHPASFTASSSVPREQNSITMVGCVWAKAAPNNCTIRGPCAALSNTSSLTTSSRGLGEKVFTTHFLPLLPTQTLLPRAFTQYPGRRHLAPEQQRTQRCLDDDVRLPALIQILVRRARGRHACDSAG